MLSSWAGRTISRLKRQRTGDPSSGAEPTSPIARRTALRWAMTAIGLGLAAQFALTAGPPLLGAIGLAAAVVLFVANLRPFLVEPPVKTPDLDVLHPATQEAGGEAGNLPRRSHISGDPVRLPGRAADLVGRWQFIMHNWRELTIAEMVSGSFPLLPQETESRLTSAAGTVDAAAPVLCAPVSPETPAVVDGALNAPPTGAAPVRSARLIRWTAGLRPSSQPQAVAVAPQGDVLVLDAEQEMVYRFDPQGRSLEEWSVSGLAELDVCDLAVSPDGDAIYLVDAASRSVCVIALSDQE